MATTSSLGRWRPGSVAVAGAATAAVLSFFGGASSIGASGETSSTDDTTTTTVAATTTAASSESSAPAASDPTASSEEFAATLAATCEGDAGHPLLAAALRNAALPDGSLRVVNVLQTCDVVFIGAVDAELGRPLTNVEELIADPVNNVTPNQAQRDVLNAELAVYWRLAEAWAQAQAGAGAPTETEATADTTPTSVDAPATTGG